MNRRTFVLILVAALCLANLSRWALRSRVGRERFSAESAAHYRYTRMVAEGIMVPSLDRDAQWPEGLRVYRETSIGMEYLYGLAYRAIPARRPPLEEFARWFSAAIFTLASLPLALLAASLWRSRGAGALAAVLFAVALPVASRSNGFELIRENLTIPLIALNAWLICRACAGSRQSGLRTAVLSAPALFLAMATWQGTQFYLVPLLILLAARRIAGAGGAGERAAGWATVAAAAAAGAAVPFLREGRFLLSPAAACAAAWTAAACVEPALGRAAAGAADGGGGRRGIILRGGAAAAAAGLVLLPSALVPDHFAAYSHLFRLVIAKLRHVYKPSDPRLLPFDVRSFWVGPFHSPDALHLFVFALPLLVLLPGPAARLARAAREGEFAAVFILSFAAVFFILFLLMMRLLPFFGVFAIAVAAGAAAPAGEGRGGRSAATRLLPAAAVIAVMSLQVFFWAGPGDIWRGAARALRIPQRRSFVVYPVAPDPEGDMLRWIQGHTAPGDVVLSLHYLSPQILTYTGRPTVLNDFFEAPRLRGKTHRFLRALYASERTLLEFCRETGSSWLVLSAAVGCDPTRDSPLYQAGLGNMPPDCAAYRLMFEPGRLDSFDLVYENEMYRIFRAGEAPRSRRLPRSPLFYEAELLWRLGGDIEGFYDTVMHIYAVTVRAAGLERTGRAAEAEGALAGTLRTFYFHPAWRLLDRIYARGRRVDERLALARFAAESDPWRAEIQLALAESAVALGDGRTALEALRRCAGLPMDESETARFRELSERFDTEDLLR
ncbi:MAG: hypothetical protein PHQ19_06485 [Candidatus Krumholzibacteria bacterium]|nr:hypothetical protein [Candidatus Krumholzibacteria bacterium]